MTQTEQLQWAGLVKQAAHDAQRDLLWGGGGAALGAGLGSTLTPASLFQGRFAPGRLASIQEEGLAPMLRGMHEGGGLPGVPLAQKLKLYGGAGLQDALAAAAKYPKTTGGLLGAAELGGLGLLASHLTSRQPSGYWSHMLGRLADRRQDLFPK